MARLNAALADRYLLERALGAGGMATVYLGRDLRHDRRVAVKVMHADLANAVAADRFLREIRIEAGLNHPNIITLLDSGLLESPPDPPRPYYVMPHVEGESLRERLRREGSLPIDEVVHVGRDVAEALTYAHGRGVIHRDIKPENILLAGHHVVVADFGIARVLDASGLPATTSGSMVVGTPYYMSPEQWSADRRLDGRTDIYSLGCVLYEMLAGEPPFTGPTAEAIRARHAMEPPRPISTIRPSVPDGLIRVIERTMAKVPADRFQTSGDLAAALADRQSLAARRRRPGPRAIVAGVAALGAVLLAARLLWPAPDPALDRNRFVVLPFIERPGDSPPIVGGTGVARAMQTGLERWADLRVVSNLQIEDITDRRGPPGSVQAALALTRELGAGFLVWGEIWTAGDTTWVRADLYDVNRRGSHAGQARASLVTGSIGDEFARLSDALVAGAVGAMSVEGAALTGTRSAEALQTFATGDSALAAWDFERAEARLRAALTLDPDYPQANLRLAQMLHWMFRPPSEWGFYAEAALRGADRLSLSDSTHATALAHLARARYPESCHVYRGLVRRDSLDFAAWFGLGECQSRDSLVVPDPSSPSGWRFRSSGHAAFEAYTRALRLVPSVHLVYQGAAFDRLGRLLFADPNATRPGAAAGRDGGRFAAFPGLERDTLSFVPWPSRDVFAARREAVPETRFDAVDRNRRRLREIAGTWMMAYPESVSALLLWAHALELSGTLGQSESQLPSARDAVRQIRRLSTGPDDLTAVWEVRLLLKSGRMDAAKRLADTLLGGSPSTPTAAQALAGLAALTGRIRQAADLLSATTEMWEPRLPDDRAVPVPAPLRLSALRLLAFAGFGVPQDTLRALERRIRTEVEGFAAPHRREEYLVALMYRPSEFAWDVLDRPVFAGYLQPALEGVRRSDTASVRRLFDLIREVRARQRPGDVSIDYTFLEARLLLAIGDSAAAHAWLGPPLETLPSLGRYLLLEYPQAAALGSAMALLAELSAALGHRDRARIWAQRAVALWADADPELQPRVRALRRLAGQ